MPEGDSEHSCCVNQISLGHNLNVRRTIKRKIIQRGRPMILAFRMLPRLIAHWNFIKGGIYDHSRVLKNHKPPFGGSNGY